MKTEQGLQIAEILFDKSYGDVSEYKAEIERLNSHNGFLQSVISHSKDMLDEAVKQAKIDVLNELKKKTHNYYPSIDSYCVSQHIVLVRDIDELIKEVEDAEDKG